MQGPKVPAQTENAETGFDLLPFPLQQEAC